MVIRIGWFIFLPNQDAEGLFVWHVHQQRANQECETLAITDLCIVETEALEYSSKHALTIAFRISEHINAGEASTKVLGDDSFVWARFTGKTFENFLQGAVSGAGHTLPNHSS